MARIFLDANESRNGAFAANDTVFGNTGTESVSINTGATNVRVEGTIEAVTLAGAPSAFTYRAEGNNLVVFSGGVQVARIIVQDDANGTTINFNGGSVTANVGAGGLTLGGTVVPTTTGPVVPGDFDQNAQLTSSLQTLADAQEARAEFLASEEADLDDDQTTVTTEAEIETNLTDAQTALAAAPTAAQLNAAVGVAQADFDAVQDRVDAVAGLNEAIEDFRAAEEARDAAADSATAVLAEVNAAEARYETRNAPITINPDLTVTGVIEFAADGETLVLVSGVTETTNVGVTQLLASLRNYQGSLEALDDANTALDTAGETLDVLDADVSADDEREDLADFRAATEAYDTALTAYVAGDATSEAALVSAYNALITAGADDVADGFDAANTNAVNAAAIDADSVDIQTEISQTEGELEDDLLAAESVNPIYDDYVVAEAALSDAQDDVEARAELVADVQDAQALADQLDALSNDVDAAVAAIEDLGFEAPIVLDGAVTATARNDIFVAAGDDATIARFGRSGDDLLFVGGDISLVELEAGDDITDTAFGSATQTEAFIQQVGGNTVIFVENEAFNGSDTDGTFDGYTITLTGVTAANVTFDNGYFSIA